MLIKTKIINRFALLLCVCILLTACLSIPAMATTREKDLSWSNASVRNRDTITGFSGQPMAYAYATKSGSGNYITATGYVENICINEYDMRITEYFYCSYNGDSGVYPIDSALVSTTVGATPISASVSFSDFVAQNSEMLQVYTVYIDRSYAKMTVNSTCPYPRNMYYTDIYTLPSLAS